MKNYDLTPQEASNFCVPSVLQAIFRRHGIGLSQIEIARNLTPSINGFYADDDRIEEFMRSRGYRYSYFAYNQTPFNEPDMLLREMNDNEGIIGIHSHVYLLEEFKDPDIVLLDPKGARIARTDMSKTLSYMKEGFGFFGLVERL